MREEGERRDQSIGETMRRVLTPVEIELLLLAAKVLHKLADGWNKPKEERKLARSESDRGSDH
jgi:hypothetical protein